MAALTRQCNSTPAGNWWGDPTGPQGANGDGVLGHVDAGNPLAAPLDLGTDGETPHQIGRMQIRRDTSFNVRKAVDRSLWPIIANRG